MSTELTPAATRTVARPVAVAAGVAAGLAVWVVAVPVAGIDLAARVGGTVTPIGPIAVAAVALLAGLAGWGLLTLLERRTAHSRRVWTATAAVGLVLSLFGPLGGVSPAAIITLAGMHLGVGAVLIALLPRARRVGALARRRWPDG